MDFMKFWRLAERHPWLTRLLIDPTDPSLQNDPSFINEEIGIYAIENEVKYIAFRPWSSLDLASVPSRDEASVAKGSIMIMAVNYDCYYHHPNSESALLSNFFLLASSVELGKTVEDVLGEIALKGAVLDAVVRRCFECQELSTEGKEKVKTHASPLADFEGVRTSFEIFLPNVEEVAAENIGEA